MDLIQQAKQAARKAPITQAELAKRAGVSLRWVQLLLSGSLKDPSYKRLQAVIRAAGPLEAK